LAVTALRRAELEHADGLALDPSVLAQLLTKLVENLESVRGPRSRKDADSRYLRLVGSGGKGRGEEGDKQSERERSQDHRGSSNVVSALRAVPGSPDCAGGSPRGVDGSRSVGIGLNRPAGVR
jgi:hypothetical protein